MVSNLETEIKKLEVDLSIFQVQYKNNEKFNVQIKLGDLFEKSGDIDRGIKYFNSAYDTAVFLESEKYQVDALVKITEGYFYKGEIEESIRYAEIVEKLLKNMDYVKGKLDISLYLLKVYHIKNEYFKAREIGNEALKLCTEEHIIYKGRILNALANLYWEITSIDENLELLKQSLACFEKANSLRGILGVINNIGSIYAERLQNNEKALEYFLKLKKRSEDSNYSEFNVFAYFNIGETYYKCLKYEEALYWCKLALKKAQVINMEAMVFYSYAILISINLKLYNYKEAFAYFNLANIELESYPNQGVRLPWYYKSVASLSSEFGDIPKAKHNIKLALDMLGNEEFVIKWDTGIVYEFVKLKEAKSKTEILGVLEGITYLLSNYKNSEIISDIVCDVALQLIDLNQSELAFNLIDQYRDMTSENGVTELKHMYIEALRCNNKDKGKMLNNALELVVKIKNIRLYLKISSSLGEYYLKANNYEKAINCYLDACTQVKNIVKSVPEEFRVQYINSNNLLKYYNVLVRVKEDYSKRKGEIRKKYECINNETELLEFFEDLDEIIT